jgi:hypothetical protein
MRSGLSRLRIEPNIRPAFHKGLLLASQGELCFMNLTESGTRDTSFPLRVSDFVWFNEVQMLCPVIDKHRIGDERPSHFSVILHSIKMSLLNLIFISYYKGHV